jgi:hypothetical protein
MKRRLKLPTARTNAIESALRALAHAEVDVLLAELDEATPRAPRKLRPMCSALTAKGLPCGARAAPTGVLCRLHASMAQTQKSRP